MNDRIEDALTAADIEVVMKDRQYIFFHCINPYGQEDYAYMVYVPELGDRGKCIHMHKQALEADGAKEVCPLPDGEYPPPEWFLHNSSRLLIQAHEHFMRAASAFMSSKDMALFAVPDDGLKH